MILVHLSLVLTGNMVSQLLTWFLSRMCRIINVSSALGREIVCSHQESSMIYMELMNMVPCKVFKK